MALALCACHVVVVAHPTDAVLVETFHNAHVTVWSVRGLFQTDPDQVALVEVYVGLGSAVFTVTPGTGGNAATGNDSSGGLDDRLGDGVGSGDNSGSGVGSAQSGDLSDAGSPPDNVRRARAPSSGIMFDTVGGRIALFNGSGANGAGGDDGNGDNRTGSAVPISFWEWLAGTKAAHDESVARSSLITTSETSEVSESSEVSEKSRDDPQRWRARLEPMALATHHQRRRLTADVAVSIKDGSEDSSEGDSSESPAVAWEDAECSVMLAAMGISSGVCTRCEEASATAGVLVVFAFSTWILFAVLVGLRMCAACNTCSVRAGAICAGLAAVALVAAAASLIGADCLAPLSDGEDSAYELGPGAIIGGAAVLLTMLGLVQSCMIPHQTMRSVGNRVGCCGERASRKIHPMGEPYPASSVGATSLPPAPAVGNGWTANLEPLGQHGGGGSGGDERASSVDVAEFEAWLAAQHGGRRTAGGVAASPIVGDPPSVLTHIGMLLHVTLFV
jgi:hypothetical protein